MKKLALIFATLTFAITPAHAVVTNIHFGPYLNCHVYNDSSVPIRVVTTTYSINGYYGQTSHTDTCAAGCLVPPYTTTIMSGPKNSPNITQATCNVVFNY